MNSKFILSLSLRYVDTLYNLIIIRHELYIKQDYLW